MYMYLINTELYYNWKILKWKSIKNDNRLRWYLIIIEVEILFEFSFYNKDFDHEHSESWKLDFLIWYCLFVFNEST